MTYSRMESVAMPMYHDPISSWIPETRFQSPGCIPESKIQNPTCISECGVKRISRTHRHGRWKPSVIGVILIVAFAVPGCVQDPTSVLPVAPTPSAKGVYIVNEGTWGRGNASLTYYDLESFSAYTDVFSAVNGRNLGDVGNQMVIRGSRGYVVVNNSDRIEVLDLATNTSLGTISVGAGMSPRQMAFVNDSLGLVTALYDNSVLLLNLGTYSVEGRIPVGANPEGLVVTSGKAYVANSGFGSGRTLSIIDLGSRLVIKTVTVGDNPSAVALSGGGEIYVLCGGFYNDFADPNDDTPATLAVLSPVTDSVVDTIRIGDHAMTMALSQEGTGYVPTSNAVWTVDTRSHRVVGKFLEGYYYGVGVEEVSGDVYLTDPGNFVTPGKVLVYSPNGQMRNTFQAGVIPGSIAFKR